MAFGVRPLLPQRSLSREAPSWIQARSHAIWSGFKRRMAFCGHEVLIVRRQSNTLDEHAGGGIAGSNDGAIFAALHQRIVGVDAQTALSLGGAVTRDAIGIEDGMDVLA